jgi:hypothetical protein
LLLFHHLQPNGPGLCSRYREQAIVFQEEFPRFEEIRFIVYVKNGIGVRHDGNTFKQGT